MPAPSSSRVKVIVRLRPTDADDGDDSPILKVQLDPDSPSPAPMLCLRSKDAASWQGFKFDAVCDQRATQEDVFTHMEEVLSGLEEGVSSTVFAYGSTGTGKTYTVFGKGFEDVFNSQSLWDVAKESIYAQRDYWGIIPRSIYQLFARLESIKDRDDNASFTVSGSFMQIYNDRVNDLLASNRPKSTKLGLPIREDVNAPGGVNIDGLSSHTVDCPEDAIKLLYRGGRRRIVRETSCNERSSRSHAIFRLDVEIFCTDTQGNAVTRHSLLNMIDLSGSERWGSDERSQYSARELTNINSSLSTLGNCVSALVRSHSHIPFRDSSLTRILKDCLGGGARAIIVATASALPSARFDTASTLAFASRAIELSKVVPDVRVDEKIDDAVLLRRAKAEIRRLKVALEGSSSTKSVTDSDDDDMSDMWDTKVSVATRNINDLVDAIEEGHLNPGDVCTELESFFTLSRRLQERIGTEVEEVITPSVPTKGGEETSERPTDNDNHEKETSQVMPAIKESSDSNVGASYGDSTACVADSPPAASAPANESPRVEAGTPPHASLAKPRLSPVSPAAGKHEELCCSFEDQTSSIIASPASTIKVKPEVRTCNRHDLEDCFLCQGASTSKRKKSARVVATASPPKLKRSLNKPASEPRPRWTHRMDASKSTKQGKNVVVGREVRRRHTLGSNSTKKPSIASGRAGKTKKPSNASGASRAGRKTSAKISSRSARPQPTTSRRPGLPSRSAKKPSAITNSSNIPTIKSKVGHTAGRPGHEDTTSAKERARMAIAEASRVLANM